MGAVNVRVFDQRTKQAVYAAQTERAREAHVSNCPLCAAGSDANCDRIYRIGEMEADHVAARSRGGSTDISNCQMLCRTLTRAKGNR